MKRVIEWLQTKHCRVKGHHSNKGQADVKDSKSCGKPKRAALSPKI
jgi:hypothetical protein